MDDLFYKEGRKLICRLSCIILLFILAPVTTAFGNSASKLLPGLDTVSLKLKWKHQFQFAGYYAALEKGFYREAGLDVQIHELNAAENAFKSVLEGECEFGISGSDIALKRSEGDPVVVLAAIFQHSPMVFLTPESTGIQNIHQLVGRRVMLEEHSAELLAYLKTENIDLKKLHLVEHSYGIKELVEGRIDVISAYVNDEPFNLKERQIPYRTFFPQSSGIDFYGDVLFTTETQVKQYPKRVKKFLAATIKGWNYALENPEEIIELIFTKYSQRHSREHLRFEAEGARKLILPEVVPIGYMNEGRWNHILEKYQGLGLIKQPVDLDQFIYSTEPQPTNYFLTFIQLVEMILAILALWFVWRFIRIYSSNEELQRNNNDLQRRLGKNQQRFSMLLANLPGMAYRCKFDQKYSMIFVSQGAFDLTGYYPDEMVKNKAVAFADIIHEDDRKMVYEEVKKSFHRGEPFKIDYRIKCRDGSIKWVHEQGRFASNNFKKLRIEGLIIDNTAVKELGLEKSDLCEQLQKASAEIKKLRGMLPICSACRKIRDDQKYLEEIEIYMQSHENGEFSTGVCPDCARILYPEFNLEDKD